MKIPYNVCMYVKERIKHYHQQGLKVLGVFLIMYKMYFSFLQ